MAGAGMLEQIRIRSLGVIEQAEIDFAPGFTALTGETGAGKTMVLTALGLVLGNKADASLVRTGAERMAVAATFSLDTPEAVSIVDGQGGEIEDGRVVLARMISSDGKTRALIGGASTPASVLTELGEELISIHAQLSSTRLLKPARQRQLIDRFGKLDAQVAAYSQAFTQLRDAERALENFQADRANAQAIAVELRTLVDLVSEVTPQSGEYSELESKISRLSHHDDIARAVETARSILSDDEGASSLLGQVRRSLESVKGRDSELDDVITRAVDLSVLANDLAADLARYQDALELDPGALDLAHARMSRIQSLLRRFSLEASDAGISSLLEQFQSGQERLVSLEAGEEKATELALEVRRCRSAAADAAVALSSARHQAALVLSDAVTAEVRSLAMPHATFTIHLSRKEDAEGLEIQGQGYAFDASGIDTVEFRLAATASTPAVPVAKGASGGELSRVMLALEVVLAGIDPVATYVFDEVDAGIGGSAALEVGRRLARLAQHAQVIVVTHLAQVAAFADHHVVVTKGDSGSVTASEVRGVAGSEREAELARMMAGLADSASAQASAAELLALGARER